MADELERVSRRQEDKALVALRNDVRAEIQEVRAVHDARHAENTAWFKTLEASVTSLRATFDEHAASDISALRDLHVCIDANTLITTRIEKNVGSLLTIVSIARTVREVAGNAVTGFERIMAGLGKVGSGIAVLYALYYVITGHPAPFPWPL